jgi:protein tyrosine/serine phosphatase
VDQSRWIDLDGAVNVRDLGGLPTDDGRVTARDRLIRSDNLQGLSPRDVRCLVDEHHVRAVADLRTGVALAREGPGPMTKEPGVVIEHLSLFPEAGHNTDVAAVDDGGPVVLPWQNLPSEGAEVPKTAADFYQRYLLDRADSIIDTLRLVARTDGATIVHCAAGKDRTGVVVAIALAEVGVRREQIIEDYAMSAQRIHEIFDRLRASDTYAEDVERGDGDYVEKHAPRDTTMEQLLDGIDAAHGGVGAWLRKHGWTEADASALRAHLVE